MGDQLPFNGEGGGSLEEVLLAYLEAADRGQAPERQRLLEAHPQFRAELAEFFAGERLVDSVAAPLRWAVKAALKTPLPTQAPVNGTPRFCGNHELLEEIGRGGTIVYRARDNRLGRCVALKLFHLLPFAEDGYGLHRFRNEVETIAQLDQPHIVPIYEVGEEGGQLYFTMKLYEGGSLSGQLPRFRSDPRAAARLVATVARAVHHAHQRGVLHRDLKPANVLLDEHGRPAVGDFGLAKRAGGGELTLTAPTDLAASEGQLTVTASTGWGAIVGTPAYMAPEQAAGRKDLTTAVDVHGLGALLYTLLTGRPPFRGASVGQTLDQVRTCEPEPPSRGAPGTDRDLETVCLKCLDKEPARRYGSAEALADDLERWLRGEPIQARRIGRWRRTWRWCRRNPVTAALVAVTILLALGLVAGLAVSAGVFAGQRDELREEHKRTLERERDLRHHLYASDMRVGWQAWQQGDLARLDELLERHRPRPGEEDNRTFVWYHLRRLCRGLTPARSLEGHEGDVYSVAFAPDGLTLATAGKDGTVRLWDLASGRERVRLDVDSTEVNAVAFSPDGKTLAAASDGGKVKLWDTVTGREQGCLQAHRGEASTVAFSPDGKTVASGGEDRTVRLWDRASLAERSPAVRHGGPVKALAFSPDGKSLITSDWEDSPQFRGGVVSHTDLATRHSRQGLVKGAMTFAIAHSRDGRLVAVDDGVFVCLCDPLLRATPHSWRGHTGGMRSVAFSPDDRLLASSAEDGVRVWDVNSRSLRHSIPSSGERIWCVRFSPDGRTLATGGRKGAVRLYDLAAAQPRKACPPLGKRLRSMVVSQDGRLVAAHLEDSSVRTWNVATGEPGPECVGHQTYVLSMCFNASGTMLLTVGPDQTARLWDVATGKPLAAPLRHPATPAQGVALSPDGTIAVTVCDRRIRCWETATGRELDFCPEGDARNGVEFSPDGKMLALVVRDHKVQLWDWETRSLRHTFRGPRDPGKSIAPGPLAFNADAGLLAVGGDTGIVKIWDTRTGRELHTLTGHRGGLVRLAFSPDGKTLATGGGDTAIKLWDVPTGQELASLEGHTAGMQLAFTPDGTTLISAAVDGDGRGELYKWSADAADDDSLAR